MKALRVHYEGRVQGVGFRWMIRDLAKGYEVCGSVRNLDDGRVEVIVSGDDSENFLEAVGGSPLAGHITSVRREELMLQNRPRGFQIVA